MDISRSAIKLFIANIGGAIIQFAGIAYFAREIGPAELGIFFLFQAIVGIISIPSDFGIKGALEKRISEGHGQSAFLSSSILLKLGLSIIVSAAVLLLSSYLNSYIGADIAVFIPIAIISQEMAELFIGGLKGELRVGETAILNLSQQAIWVLVSLSLISMESKGLIIGYISSFVFIMVISFLKMNVSLGMPSYSKSVSLLNFGKFNLISSVGGYVYSWMDIAIIGFFLTQSHVGTYEVAWRVTGVVVLLSRSLAGALFPQISHWDSNKDVSSIERSLKSAIFPSIVVAVPSLFGSLVFGDDVLTHVFGQEYAGAALVLSILMLEKVIQSVYLLLNRFLQGIDMPELSAYATIGSLITNICLNLLLIPLYGIVGAAIATTAASCMNGLLHYYYLSNTISVTVEYDKVAWTILSSIVMFAFAKSIASVVVISNLPQLLFVIILSSAVYAITMLIYQPIRSTALQFAPI
jgi:O-antigen/teichoic acid export membrane protein